MMSMSFKYKIKFLLIFITLILITLTHSQEKAFSVEVYPSEQDEDNSIFAGDDLYRANLRSMWNNVNPNYGYSNSPFMMPPYMPMMGYSQPVMPGNYFMGGSQINPINYNYPKMANVRGSQYANYPKFQESKKQNQVNSESANLAKELEKQIKELQTLTKEAKEIAKKKLSEENSNSSSLTDSATKKSAFLEIKGTSESKPKRSNLEQISLDSSEKRKFDETMKNVINKLDNAS